MLIVWHAFILPKTFVLHRFGLVTLEVRLTDDGGSMFGGKDRKTQTMSLEILRPLPLQNEAIQVLEINDNLQKSIFPRWKDLLPISMSDFPRLTFNVMISSQNAKYFAQPPAVLQDGSLTFQLSPGTFGLAQILLETKTEDPSTNQISVSEQTVNISILEVSAAWVCVFVCSIFSCVCIFSHLMSA